LVGAVLAIVGSCRSRAPFRRAGAVVLLLLAAMLADAGVSAFAQIPGGILPGRERQQILDQRVAPRAVPGGRAISLPSTEAPPGAADITLVIRGIQVVGSTVYTPDQLAPIWQDLINRRVSLNAVYDLAKRITSKYGADGYVLSRAIVPPQELSPGGAVIRIQVVEGYVSRVVWPREKLARYRDFFTDYSAKIVADRPANIRTLERYLLLANDLPGLKFTTTLEASKTEQGASVLIVEVTEKRYEFNARADNRGTEARGPYQFLLAQTFNNLSGTHESFTVAYAGVQDIEELQFIAGNYRHVVNSEGLTGFVNATYSWGRPGGALLQSLDYRTRTTTLEMGMFKPIIRSRERNLTLTGMTFLTESYSFINLTDPGTFQVDRLRGIRARVDADAADRFNGINQMSFTVSQGFPGFGATVNGNPLATRFFGKVDFTKLELSASRLQPLFGQVSALISAYGQWAADPLLASEQCGYGGRVFGRAYDPSELLGDHCWMASAELRYDLASKLPKVPDAQFYAYSDVGQVFTIIPAVGTAETTAASAGGGVRLKWQNFVLLDLSAAKAIEGPRDDWRFFFITSVRY
jgi:hemolysin activation/secretion protein